MLSQTKNYLATTTMRQGSMIFLFARRNLDFWMRIYLDPSTNRILWSTSGSLLPTRFPAQFVARKLTAGAILQLSIGIFFVCLIGRHVDDCLRKEKSEQCRKEKSQQYRTGVENCERGGVDGFLKLANKSGPVKVEGPMKKRPANSEKPTVIEFFNRPSGGPKRLKLNEDRVRKSENLRDFLDARKR